MEINNVLATWVSSEAVQRLSFLKEVFEIILEQSFSSGIIGKELNRVEGNYLDGCQLGIFKFSGIVEHILK